MNLSDRTNIVLISGKVRAGKDQLAEFLKERLEEKGLSVVKRNLADSLKESFAQVFPHLVKGTKEDIRAGWIKYASLCRAVNAYVWCDHTAEYLRQVTEGDLVEWVIIPDVRYFFELHYWAQKAINNGANLYVIRLSVTRSEQYNRLGTDGYLKYVSKGAYKDPSETQLDYLESCSKSSDRHAYFHELFKDLVWPQLSVFDNSAEGYDALGEYADLFLKMGNHVQGLEDFSQVCLALACELGPEPAALYTTLT